MRAIFILSFMIFSAGCASLTKIEKGGEAPEMASIVGTLLETKIREQHIWLEGKAGHDTSWSNEIDLAIDAPSEFEGLRLRFSMPVDGPVSFDGMKGKKVRITLPKTLLSQLTVQLPIVTVRIEEEPNQTSEPIPPRRDGSP